MKHFFQILFVVFMSSVFLTSCMNSSTPQLKGEKANTIVSINLKNSPELIKKLETTALLDAMKEEDKTKIKEVIAQIKNAQIQMAFQRGDRNVPEVGQVIVSGLGKETLQFIKDIKAGYESKTEISEEESTKTLNSIRNAKSIQEVFANGKKIGQSIWSESKKIKEPKSSQKIEENAFKTLLVSGDSVSSEMYESADKALTGLAKNNTEYGELKQGLSGKELISVYAVATDKNMFSGLQIIKNPSSVLGAVSVQKESTNFQVHIKSKNPLTKEDKETLDTDIKSFNEKMQSFLSEENPLVKNFVLIDGGKEVVQKLQKELKVTHAYKGDSIVSFAVNIPLTLDEVEKFAPLLIQTF